MTENSDKELQELKDAFQAVASSMSCTPIIYDDGKDDGTNQVKAVWCGKPIHGPDAAIKADAITKAKMEEYKKIGIKAFEDTEPLDNVLLPGENRFV